jgi:hypothetical protein
MARLGGCWPTASDGPRRRILGGGWARSRTSGPDGGRCHCWPPGAAVDRGSARSAKPRSTGPAGVDRGDRPANRNRARDIIPLARTLLCARSKSVGNARPRAPDRALACTPRPVGTVNEPHRHGVLVRWMARGVGRQTPEPFRAAVRRRSSAAQRPPTNRTPDASHLVASRADDVEPRGSHCRLPRDADRMPAAWPSLRDLARRGMARWLL